MRKRRTRDHFIPRFHLRLFEDDSVDDPGIWRADVESGAILKTGASELAVIRGYNDVDGYEVRIDGEPVSLEEAYTRLEVRADSVMKRLAAAPSTTQPEPADREALLLYVALQMTRSPAVRAARERFARRIEQAVRMEMDCEWDGAPANLRAEARRILASVPGPDVADMVRPTNLHLAVNGAWSFLERQLWAVLLCPPGSGFVMADVCVSVLKGQAPPDMVDLASDNPGVEFCMPISPAVAVLSRCELDGDGVSTLAAEDVACVNQRSCMAASRWLFAADPSLLEHVVTHRSDPIPGPLTLRPEG